MGQDVKRNACRVLGERTNLSTEHTLVQDSVLYFQYATPPVPLVKAQEIGLVLHQTPLRPAAPPRLARYSEAEAALRSSFQRCQEEPSSQELQIRALKAATAILNSRAEDVRSDLVRLQDLLSNRATDPPIYESFQRDRWMQERREVVITSQSKTVLEHLTSLAESPDLDFLEDNVGNLSKEDNNLLRYFEISQRPSPLRTRRRRHGPRSLVDIPTFPRRHKHSTLLPLVLKPRIDDSRPLKPEPFTPMSLQHKDKPASPPPLASSPPTRRHSRNNSLGTAVIYKAHDHDPPSDDLFSEVEGSIPDYAVDLIAAFDADRDVVLRTIYPTNPVKAEVHPPPLRKFPSSWRVSLRSIPEGVVAWSKGTPLTSNDSGENPRSDAPAADKTVLSRVKRRLSGIIS
ncbi:hypothetical protein K443DRAFT_409877 [Laccaria amethystina LaAM-08-1]|uniref:Uncharacterized protein n=1 Tax=Laccaria amethystina LaAM-08-1 TaxID=1095629 RepID=A0A0C9Y388_9AGAR|nr:hypothetical protein K443DRAFT_409877 [Laccaria amethystina LaAM-08-1]